MSKFLSRNRPLWSLDRPRPDPLVPEVPLAVDPSAVHRAGTFPDAGPSPWLDRPDARDAIAGAKRAGRITAHEADFCRKWSRDGYVVAEKLFDDTFLDYVWGEYEAAIASGVLTPPDERQFEGDRLPGRTLNPHFSVPAIEEMMDDPTMVHIIELLLGVRSTAFQSISGHKASQQAVHSDSIHMTTYPPGHLIAMWIAFEDIDPGSGPLVFYPTSHRLPYLYSEDVGIEASADRIPDYRQFDEKYTPAIYRKIEEADLQPRYFHAKRGDVLFWHANLLHGGSERTDWTKSRKALVFHYFGAGCICYHDLSGGIAWIHTGLPGRPPVAIGEPGQVST